MESRNHHNKFSDYLLSLNFLLALFLAWFIYNFVHYDDIREMLFGGPILSLVVMALSCGFFNFTCQKDKKFSCFLENSNSGISRIQKFYFVGMVLCLAATGVQVIEYMTGEHLPLIVFPSLFFSFWVMFYATNLVFYNFVLLRKQRQFHALQQSGKDLVTPRKKLEHYCPECEQRVVMFLRERRLQKFEVGEAIWPEPCIVEIEGDVNICPLCGGMQLDDLYDDLLMKAFNICREERGLLSPEQIKEIRVALGLDLEGFSKLTGVSQEEIQRHERGSSLAGARSEKAYRTAAKLLPWTGKTDGLTSSPS